MENETDETISDREGPGVADRQGYDLSDTTPMRRFDVFTDREGTARTQ